MKLSEIVLLENIVQTFKDDIEIASFLVKNCSEWKDFSKPLWRSTESSDSEKAALRSTRIRSIRSRGGSQKIQEYVFSLPEYKVFPDRSQSIFCSTNKQTELGNDELKAIFPLDGVKMGQTDNKDFNYIKIYKNEDLTSVQHNLMMICYVYDSKLNIFGLDVSEYIDIVKQLIKENPKPENFPDEYDWIYQAILEDKFEDYFSKESLGLNLVNAKTIKHLGEKQTEVWFEGKYISLPHEWFSHVVKLANRLRAGETEEDLRAERKIVRTVKAVR